MDVCDCYRYRCPLINRARLCCCAAVRTAVSWCTLHTRPLQQQDSSQHQPRGSTVVRLHLLQFLVHTFLPHDLLPPSPLSLASPAAATTAVALPVAKAARSLKAVLVEVAAPPPTTPPPLPSIKADDGRDLTKTKHASRSSMVHFLHRLTAKSKSTLR